MNRLVLCLAGATLITAGCATARLEVEDVAAPQSANVWRAVNAETGIISDVEGLSALVTAFPDSSNVRLRFLNAQLQAGNAEEAIATLYWLNERGYVFSDIARTQIPDLIGADFAERARELLLPAAPSIERSTVFFTVPAEAGLVESVIVEEFPKRMVATSVSGRSVWGTMPDGSWKAVAPSGADNLSGLADDGGMTFWVASGNLDQGEREQKLFSGLLGIGRGVSELRFPAPEGVTLSDIHIAENRSVFASDPISGGIYVLGPERRSIEVLVAPGTFRSPQGLATSDDGTRLYVSDYRYGIAIIDLVTSHVSRLATEVPAILDGTDALFRRGNSLIAIQNGTSPMRIAQFMLSDDGLRVEDVRVLEQAHREWTEPLSGHLGPDALYYVGNGQWDKYVAGELAEGKQPEPTQVRLLPLD